MLYHIRLSHKIMRTKRTDPHGEKLTDRRKQMTDLICREKGTANLLTVPPVGV